MDNDEIEKAVRNVVRAFLIKSDQHKPLKMSEELAIESATRLVANMLQNLNDIAFYCNEQNVR